MPLLNSVTTPYAEALLQVVNENSQTEEMVSEVKQLLELINDSLNWRRHYPLPF